MLLRLFDSFLAFILRFYCFLIRVLPDPLAFFLARFFVTLLCFFVPRFKRVAKRNLELVFPNKSVRERKRILEESLNLLAKNIITFARIPTLKKETVSKEFDYREFSKQIVEARESTPGKSPAVTGVIFATMHYGCFEYFSQAQALLERPLAVLARDFGLPKIDRFWNEQREVWGNQVFSRKGGYQEIIKRLKLGQDVAVLFDQNIRAGHAVFTEFLGRKAATTKSVAIAAIRTGAPIIFTVAAANGRGYSVLSERIETFIDADISNEERIEKITTLMNLAAEKAILSHPEQWFWIHRRFKTRPFGEPENLYN